MSKLSRPVPKFRTALAVVLGASLAFLSAYVLNAGTALPSGDPDFAAGYLAGRGVGTGFVVWVICYFFAMRGQGWAIAIASLALICGFGVLGTYLVA